MEQDLRRGGRRPRRPSSPSMTSWWTCLWEPSPTERRTPRYGIVLFWAFAVSSLSRIAHLIECITTKTSPCFRLVENDGSTACSSLHATENHHSKTKSQTSHMLTAVLEYIRSSNMARYIRVGLQSVGFTSGVFIHAKIFRGTTVSTHDFQVAQNEPVYLRGIIVHY